MLRKEKLQAFTLIELLVVITILAIISVVAYTNFSGATDKAKNSKKLNDAASIETALQKYQMDNNFYPMPSQYDSTKNVWGYQNVTASIHNTLTIIKSGDQISDVTGGAGGGNVYLSGSNTLQIGAKGTIDSTIGLGKVAELLDPSIKDIKVGTQKVMKDFGVGEYIYGVYAKNNNIWNSTSKKGSAYNIAITLYDEQKGFLTKIYGDFDSNTCPDCPNSLIGDGTSNNSLNNDDYSLTGSVTDVNDRTPYPIQF